MKEIYGFINYYPSHFIYFFSRDKIGILKRSNLRVILCKVAWGWPPNQSLSCFNATWKFDTVSKVSAQHSNNMGGDSVLGGWNPLLMTIWRQLEDSRVYMAFLSVSAAVILSLKIWVKIGFEYK